jgi:hypothetical protein
MDGHKFRLIASRINIRMELEFFQIRCFMQIKILEKCLNDCDFLLVSEYDFDWQ